MTTQQQQKQKRKGNSLPLSPSLHRHSKSLRSAAASTTRLSSNMSSSLPPPTSVVHDELHALADNINCDIDDDVNVGPIYELLKDGAGEQQECENSDHNNKNNANNFALSRRKSKYGDRIKSVDALFVDMYVLNASNGLLEYNSNWRQEWDASVTARRAERAARTR